MNASESAQPSDASAAQAVLLAEYEQVASHFRALTEIRFKLLAFLPLGSAVIVLWGKPSSQPAVALFAFVITICFAVYNKRNDQLYDALVGRAAHLERELGAGHGHFNQRPGRWLSYLGVPVEHGWPIGLVYAATAAFWLFTFFEASFADASRSDRRIAAVLANVLAFSVLFGWWFSYKFLQRWRSTRTRDRARRVFAIVKDQADRGSEVDVAAAEIALAWAGRKKAPGLFGRKRHDRLVGRAAHALSHRAANLGRSDAEKNAFATAAVIDLPARWIEDVASGRR